MIVDAQIHLFDPEVARQRASALGQTVLSTSEVLVKMDEAGVSRAYLVPVGSKSNATCLDAARQWPDRFKVMGIPALNRPESRDIVPEWKSMGFHGARVTFPPYRDVSWLRDGTADWFWDVAEQAGLPVMIWAPGHFKEIADVAARHPELRITVDHLNLAMENRGTAPIQSVVDELVLLAELPNIAVKADSMPSHSLKTYPYADLHEPLRRVIAAFGPSRVFWGTDLTHLPCSISEAIKLFTDELGLDSAAQEQILGKAIVTWIGW